MGKILGSWSGMRKYLEKEMLANSLKNRVRYSCSSFKGMDGGGIFAIYVDDKTIKQFSMETVASHVFGGKSPVYMPEYWKGYWREIRMPFESRQEFDDMEFSDALKQYRDLDIHNAILSTNPIVRMFAILDRRLGKKRLQEIASHANEQPEWLQFFYRLRMEAEGIHLKN